MASRNHQHVHKGARQSYQQILMHSPLLANYIDSLVPFHADLLYAYTQSESGQQVPTFMQKHREHPKANTIDEGAKP